jgi:hypothetical protein
MAPNQSNLPRHTAFREGTKDLHRFPSLALWTAKEKEIGGLSYLKVLGRLALGLAVVGKPLPIPDLHTQTISH